jgi:hypothetical protein
MKQYASDILPPFALRDFISVPNRTIPATKVSKKLYSKEAFLF